MTLATESLKETGCDLEWGYVAARAGEWSKEQQSKSYSFGYSGDFFKVLNSNTQLFLIRIGFFRKKKSID